MLVVCIFKIDVLRAVDDSLVVNICVFVFSNVISMETSVLVYPVGALSGKKGETVP